MKQHTIYSTISAEPDQICLADKLHIPALIDSLLNLNNILIIALTGNVKLGAVKWNSC